MTTSKGFKAFFCVFLIVSGIFTRLGLHGQNSSIDLKRDALQRKAISEKEQLRFQLELAQELRIYSIDSVLNYALAAQKLASQLKDTAALAQAYRQLSWSRGLMQQNIALLIQDGQKAHELANSINDSIEIIKSGLGLALGYLAIQKVSEAEGFANLALSYAEGQQLDKIKQEAYSVFAYLASVSDVKKSLYFRKKSLYLASANKDTIAMAMGNSQIATLLKFLKSDSVVLYLQESKRLYELKASPVYEGILMYGLAEYYGDLGYGDSMLYYGLKANELARQTNYIQIQRASKALLFAYYFNRQDYTSAAPLAREVLNIEKARPSINYVSAFIDVARVESALQRPDSAENYFQAAIEALKVINSPRIEIMLRSYYGEFLNNQEQYQQAFEELRKAKVLSDKAGEAALQDFLLLQLAKARFKKRRFSEAKSFFQDAIDLGNTSNEADLLSEGYKGIAMCDSAMGSWASAFRHQRLFLQWDDSLQRRSYNEQTAEMQTRFETVQKEAQITQQELQIKQTETERNSLIVIVSVLALAGIIVLSLLFQLKKRNAKIQHQREKLSVLNESKDRLFAMIAHDLRGPITGFQSVGKIFDHYVKREELGKLSTLSQKINEQSDHLKQLLDNLLNWSLQQLGLYEAQSEKIDLHNLGAEIFQRYEAHALSKGNQLILTIPEEVNWQGDKNGLSVVLSNLLGNSIKFTEGGKIELDARQDSQEVVIALKDTGKGMNQEQLSKLRQDFRLESQKGTAGEKGTGLGLQIVYQLLAHWGASLSIDSEEGQGTEFNIHLPIVSSFT